MGDDEAVARMILQAALAPPHILSCCRLYHVAACCVEELSEQHDSCEERWETLKLTDGCFHYQGASVRMDSEESPLGAVGRRDASSIRHGSRRLVGFPSRARGY